jgi:NADH dehydrogenase/NADH:ubiquinone oxidoreductase subunit G
MNQSGCVSINIDGQALQVERGLTVLDAARQNGIEIPTLCDFPGLPASGSCRLCVVEIAGRQNTPTACTTPVEAGMVILTHSPVVVALRKELLQLLLAEHPASCLYCQERDHCDECMVTLRKAGVTTGCGSCPKDSQCELQALADKYEVRQAGYPMRYRLLPVETHDPFFDRDPNLCILCGRCIRVCQQLHLANTLTYNGRGAEALVSAAFQRSHLETSCTFCGSCVEICPTGAISEKTRKWDGKPERVTASTCPLCSMGCQINLLVKQERVMGSLPNRQAGTDVLCVNGRFGITEMVDPSTRLKHPLHLPGEGRLAGETWQPASLEDAIQMASEKLLACPPERFEMRISADCSNEDLFVARQFAREVMKSSPVLASARRRYGSALDIIARLLRTSVPLEPVLGQQRGDAPVILCLGMDAPYAQSVVAVQLKQAKSRGAKLIHLRAGQGRSGELDGSDVRLTAANGDGVGLLSTFTALSNRLAVGSTGIQQEVDPNVEQAARLLAQSNAPVIIVGAAVLAEPQNTPLLLAVEALVHRLSAQVVVLPNESNLAGALRLGLAGTSKPDCAASTGLDVLYLIGEPLPERQTGGPFIISHTLGLPPGGAFNGLLFPAAAFSEADGTLIDYAGRLQAFHAAVPPPGEATPAWKILALIARQMGAPGFDYNGVEDIWQAAQAEFAGFPAHHAWPVPAVSVTAEQIPGSGWHEPDYMGLPLAQRVAGLRSLYVDSSNVRADESNY